MKRERRKDLTAREWKVITSARRAEMLATRYKHTMQAGEFPDLKVVRGPCARFRTPSKTGPYPYRGAPTHVRCENSHVSRHGVTWLQDARDSRRIAAKRCTNPTQPRQLATDWLGVLPRIVIRRMSGKPYTWGGYA
jgi:hypothetical protein